MCSSEYSFNSDKILAIILPSPNVLQLAILFKIGKEKHVSKIAWQFRFSEIIFLNRACFSAFLLYSPPP